MIPAMTDPLGKHWKQPKDIYDAPMDNEVVVLTRHQLKELPEYSSTYPSGAYNGKCWKRVNGGTIWLCWYGDHETDKNKCTVYSRRVLIGKRKLRIQ